MAVKMKNKHIFLFILSLFIVFPLYRVDSAVAMAAEQNAEAAVDPAAGRDDEPAAEPVAETDPVADPEPEESDDSVAVPKSDDAPAVDSEPGEKDEPAANQEAEEDAEPAADPESGVAIAADSEPGENDEPEANTEAEGNDEPFAGRKAVQAVEPWESVSTGPALIDWLESHKNTGGRVKLADHVVLEEDYGYFPGAPHMPAVFVDTGRYTVTVKGVVDFMSDNHLTFSGQPDGKGIFYVAEKGMLSMQGITVESKTGALWQEEGAGLVVSGCHTTGSIHYAETPFVIEPDPVCVVVEKGQSVYDVLPKYLRCRVNRQGEVSSDNSLPLVWNLEGTEKQQEERLRFRAQGFFPQAASAESVRCTVVYNDYPLTFEEVRASLSGNFYIFKGCYTRPEVESPYTLISEYSFDAENWLVSDETMVEGTYAGFIIVVDEKQSDRAAHPYIYIRLKCNNNGTEYFSNVLCYAADNLDVMEDIGGSRGGGTSITNPPDEPQEGVVNPPSEEEQPEQGTDRGANPGKNGSGKQPDADLAENEAITDAGDSGNNGGQAVHAGRLSDAEASKAEAAQRLGVQSTETQKERPLMDGLTETDNKPALCVEADAAVAEEVNRCGSDVFAKEEAAAALSAYGENGVDFTRGFAPPAESRQANDMAIAAGVVLLAVLAGIAGFYAHLRHSWSGTNR